MDNNMPHPDDLTELERRLAAWKPAHDGLDHEAMLFAAGRASARPGGGWLAWPILSGSLALAAVALGVWLAAERSERLAPLRKLVEPALASTPVVTPMAEPLSPNSYLSLRREWEQQAGDWLNRSTAAVPKGPAFPEPPILRAWQPDDPSDPL